MFVRKVFAYCIRCIVWVNLLIVVSSLLLHSSSVTGQSSKMAFDEDKDAETVKIAIGDNLEQMVVSASNIDRKYSSRSKLFDDIFNIPITVLQQVNNLLQGIVSSPAQSLMSASGFGRSLDVKQEEHSKE